MNEKCQNCPHKSCREGKRGGLAAELCCFGSFDDKNCGRVVEGNVRRYATPCDIRKLCKACSGAINGAVAITKETA